MSRVIMSRLATMIELQTIYGNEDFYNMIEILAIDDYNKSVLSKED